MKISDRLKMSAELVPKSRLIADIGTDHGYLPVYLIKKGTAEKAVAADISPGSAAKAFENVKNAGLSGKISVRCGSGLSPLRENEFPDTIILTGMGGMLMIQILEEGREKTAAAKCLILQPQHNIDRVRAYIHSIGFKITDEDITFEQGKYYFVLKCEKGSDVPYSEGDLEVGRFLPDRNNPVFKKFLGDKIKKYEESIKTAYMANPNADVEKLEKRLKFLKEADKNGQM
ncbi:MAG: class I SAM-dependent methyltransferase [Clostridiales bacterium]|nr:class I SAM-dependent methyltransferase [Clostridiales bacterium]